MSDVYICSNTIDHHCPPNECGSYRDGMCDVKLGMCDAEKYVPETELAALRSENERLKADEEYRLMQDRIQRLVEGGKKMREDIERLRELGIKAGDEIKHLRTCIVDQADNKIEIERLKADKRELVEACEKSIGEFERLLDVLGDADFPIVEDFIVYLHAAVAKHREGE